MDYSNLQVKPSLIPGVYHISQSAFLEERGSIFTLWDKQELLNLGFPEFVQAKISISRQSVLRGLHVDLKTYKLVTIINGAAQIVLLDCRNNLGVHESIYLNGKPQSVNNPTQDIIHSILIPPGVANGHLALMPHTTFHYLWSHKYEGPETMETIKWSDICINHLWNQDYKPYLLSERDLKGDRYIDIADKFKIELSENVY